MMRILALDIGDSTIGIAVSDPLGITAQGVETYKRVSLKQDIKYIIDLLAQYQADTLVYGLPLHLDGGESEQTLKTKQFIKNLNKKILYGNTAIGDVRLIPIDERLTTRQAHQAMKLADIKRKKRAELVDMVAAQLILEAYLQGS